ADIASCVTIKDVPPCFFKLPTLSLTPSWGMLKCAFPCFLPSHPREQNAAVGAEQGSVLCGPKGRVVGAGGLRNAGASRLQHHNASRAKAAGAFCAVGAVSAATEDFYAV
ncbi:hypothetical protein, partial [Acetobacter malorum]|uniref:hypothetical protein n=1 Tax=Acetobacter malorum TaxID=178901 RepID=UPI001E63A48D